MLFRNWIAETADDFEWLLQPPRTARMQDRTTARRMCSPSFDPEARMSQWDIQGLVRQGYTSRVRNHMQGTHLPPSLRDELQVTNNILFGSLSLAPLTGDITHIT